MGRGLLLPMLLSLLVGCASQTGAGPRTLTDKVGGLVESHAVSLPALADALPVEDGAAPVSLLTLETTGALRHDALGSKAGAYQAPPPTHYGGATPIKVTPGMTADQLTDTLRSAHKPGTEGEVMLQPTPSVPLKVLVKAARIAQVEGFRRVYFSDKATEPYAPSKGWPAVISRLDCSEGQGEVLIQADRDTPWRRLRHLLDACAQAGLVRVAWLCLDDAGELVKVRTYLPRGD